MTALTALPFELQELIYEFDGRYKAAMRKTLFLIEQWGRTAIHGCPLNSPNCLPLDSPIFLETDRRAKMYTRHLVDGIIRLPHKVIDTNVLVYGSIHTNFKDVLSCYALDSYRKHIWVDGQEYKSVDYFTRIEHSPCLPYRYVQTAIGTKTRESLFYLLDPKVRRKMRRLPYSTFLEHGLSPNGSPKVRVFKTKPPKAFVFNPLTDIEIEINGREYYLRNTDIITMESGLFVATWTGDEVVWN